MILPFRRDALVERELLDSLVLRAPKEGGAPEVVAAGQRRPHGVAVDGRAVYWVNEHAHGSVMRLEK